jgi:hypothetical protein
MTVEEFERRIDVAHNAARLEELRELLRDLPGGGLPGVTDDHATVSPVPSGRSYSVARLENVRETAHSVAILGGSRRIGRWTPARVNNAFALCGGVELDFREAVMPPGITEVKVLAMWGGVDVIVPPGMNVECDGMGIMGGFDHTPEAASPDPGAPTLRVTGVALMGGVHVTVRHAGESRRDARRRQRQQRRERARELRRGRRGGRSELREGVEDIKDAARDAAKEVKRQLRRPGGGPT